MPLMEIGEFAPDTYPGTGVLAPLCVNLIPSGRGYWGVRSPASITPAMQVYSGQVNRMWYEVSALREAFTFIGSDTNLYRMLSLALDDITRLSGPYTDRNNGSSQWKHVSYSDNVYAVNGIDAMQKYVMGGGGEFIDVVLIKDTGDPLYAEHVGLTGKYFTNVSDFNILGNCKTDANLYSNRVWWSGIGRPEDFDPDPSTQADYQDIPDMGEVKGITGGEYITVLLEKGVVRADFVGPPVIFSFKPMKLGDGIGCDMPNTVIKARAGTYFHAQHGWYMFDGERLNPIGNDRIDRWWQRDMLAGTENRITAANLPDLHCIGWLYVSNDAPAYPATHPFAGERIPNKILLYSMDENKWSVATVLGETVGNASSDSATTLEGLDDRFGGLYDSIDVGYGTNVVPASFDSDQWKGTTGALAAVFSQTDYLSVLSDAQVHTFAGDPLSVIVDTSEVQFGFPDRAVITRAFPHVEGLAHTVTLEIISRVKHTPGTETISQVYTESKDGSFRTRAEGRFHRVRIRTTGEISRLLGVEVEFTKRGRR